MERTTVLSFRTILKCPLRAERASNPKLWAPWPHFVMFTPGSCCRDTGRPAVCLEECLVWGMSLSCDFWGPYSRWRFSLAAGLNSTWWRKIPLLLLSVGATALSLQQLLLEWKPGRGSSHSCIRWQLEKNPYAPFLPVRLAPQKGPAQRSFQNGLCWIFWRTNLRKFQNNPYSVHWILSCSPTTPETPLVVLHSMTRNELLPLLRDTGSQQWFLLLSSKSNASIHSLNFFLEYRF